MPLKLHQKSYRLPEQYFRARDFEYVQFLYDLAFLLQIDALAKKTDTPEYRTFALWKAAISLDGYTSNVDLWLENGKTDELLDSKPSNRIHDYLKTIKDSGSIKELTELKSTVHSGCLRLRSLRGLGTKQIAEVLANGTITDIWLSKAKASTGLRSKTIINIWEGKDPSMWQAAHIVPPLLRLLQCIEKHLGTELQWFTPELGNGINPIPGIIQIDFHMPSETTLSEIAHAVSDVEHFFKLMEVSNNHIIFTHCLGWQVSIKNIERLSLKSKSIFEIATQSDSMLPAPNKTAILGDLHTHTHWSDGAASIMDIAEAAHQNGLEYIAITDHSRGCKLQGGLTPVTWLRQAVSLSLLKPSVHILHGIEVDILPDGALDLPTGILKGMDIVIGSVHTSWQKDIVSNTNRVLQAIGSGQIDILGHPTAKVLGQPGIPNYQRDSVPLNWDILFEACKKWSVALEFNCFPSRLDLTIPLLKTASKVGCWISFGSDAHSRAHVKHLNIANHVLQMIDHNHVLNMLPFEKLKLWLKDARRIRAENPPEPKYQMQYDLFSEVKTTRHVATANVRVAGHTDVPAGSLVVGLDLTASKAKPTGAAILSDLEVRTCSLVTDEEILAFIVQHKPSIVSIDSPLGLPGGGLEVKPSAGIVRIAEHDLSSVGIPAYPALIDSMKPLTLRGIKLRHEIEATPNAPLVIESYPGAAQDILCIPRKQKGLNLLRAGLRELGLYGPGLDTQSHDEMDAITSAIVGRFYEVGEYEPMGTPAEAQLIVPKLNPLQYGKLPVICLAGKTGVGKSVVARYLSLFYGFHWLKTRDVIRALLLDDIHAPMDTRMFHKQVDPDNIRNIDLNEFGVLILEKYQQKPLLNKLRSLVAAQNKPVVVDAVRDTSDYEILEGIERMLLMWFIDAPEHLIQSRLIQREKKSHKPVLTNNSIDQKMGQLKEIAQGCIKNDGSLEDLRWRVDDEIFNNLTL